MSGLVPESLKRIIESCRSCHSHSCLLYALPLCLPHPLSVSVLCLKHLNCSHLACISSSAPLQIHPISLQSSPDHSLNFSMDQHLQPACFTHSSLKLPTLLPAPCLTPGRLPMNPATLQLQSCLSVLLLGPAAIEPQQLL